MPIKVIPKTNDELVDAIRVNEDYLMFKRPRDEKVLDAMRRVDRKDFLLRSLPFLNTWDQQLNKETPYEDGARPIGFKQTCSEPSMVAFIDDILELQKGMTILEIGTGCGYHAATVSELVGEKGLIISYEIVPELAAIAEQNLRTLYKSDFDTRFDLKSADGSIGRIDAKVDRIYFPACVTRTFDPNKLTKLLKPDGFIVYVREKDQGIHEITKQYHQAGIAIYPPQKFGPVSFVPATGANV